MSNFCIRFFGFAPMPVEIPRDLIVEAGDRVVAEFQGLREIGEILLPGQAQPQAGEREAEDKKLRVLRIVTKNDHIRIAENERLARIAKTKFLDILGDKGQKLVKVIDAHYNLGREQLIIRVSTPDESELRAEAAELQQQLKTHVDLRRLSPRETAVMLGGLGECGRAFCCRAMKNFVGNVNVRMARAQIAGTNPSAMYGACGRLRCCLRYEQDHYQRVLDLLPERGAVVMTPDGRGRVKDHRLMQERVVVALDTGRVSCYAANEITLLEKTHHAIPNPPPD
jgi:cell fate regulator YaaT (PSP1 superfamily)